MKFNQLKLNSSLESVLFDLGFTHPTQVQRKVIPLFLESKDLLVLSPTGTGKTASYALPIISKMLQSNTSSMIIVPTRELACQVQKVFKAFGEPLGLTSTLLIGGVSLNPQLKSLYSSPKLIIGTPGRILHFSKLKLIPSVHTLVLDEVDRMLDIGFKKDLDNIFNRLTLKPQTVFTSATLPSSLLTLTKSYLSCETLVDLSTPNSLAKTIKEQVLYPKDQKQKLNMLLNILDSNDGLKLIFTNRKCDTVRLAKTLNLHQVPSAYFNGDLTQSRRTQVVEKFTKGEVKVLICTDIASRGLDISGVTCVINNNLPFCAHDYSHRVGRTGRNNSEGLAFNLVLPSEKTLWNSIQRFKDTNETTSYTKPKTRPVFNFSTRTRRSNRRVQ